jgi:hypothetical protein
MQRVHGFRKERGGPVLQCRFSGYRRQLVLRTGKRSQHRQRVDDFGWKVLYEHRQLPRDNRNRLGLLQLRGDGGILQLDDRKPRQDQHVRPAKLHGDGREFDVFRCHSKERRQLPDTAPGPREDKHPHSGSQLRRGSDRWR